MAIKGLIDYNPVRAGEILKVKQVSEDLFVLTLTRRNKSNLFTQGIERLDSGREEADLILRNLQSWSPDVAARFHRRTPDVILDTPFRLICSSPSGVPFDGAFAIRQYLAVSYSWHSGDWLSAQHSAPEPGSLWPIGKRFADAILGLRGHPREGVWMDQICQEQQEGDEKQRAIACMDVVYRSCRRLVVLLEDVEVTDDEAALCERYDVPEVRWDIKAEPGAGDTGVLVSLFDKVSRARWWKRAWCFHEFVVGEPWSSKRHQEVHNTVFVLGHGKYRTITVQWLTLQSILATVIVKLDHHTPDSKYVSPILSGLDDRTSPLLDSPDRRAGATKSSFMARFNSVAQTSCSKVGDRLCVCINLLGLGLAYMRIEEPDEDEVYYLAVMLALAAGEKIPLSFSSKEPLMLDESQSWLMRPITATDTTLRKFTLGDVKGIHAIWADRMELDLVLFKHPFGNNNEEELGKTYLVFPDPIKSTPLPLKATWSGAVQSYQDDDEVEKPRRQFLAAVIAGGRGLARRLWTQIERDVVQFNYNTGIFADFQSNPDLKLNADRFLTLLSVNRGTTVDENWADFTSEAALALLTWITDPRSIYWISWRTLRGPYNRDGEQVLMNGFSSTKNFGIFDDNTLRSAAVAVPTDLLGADCSWTRAWVLVRVNNGAEVAWKVIAKCLLLGDTDLAEEVRRAMNGEQFGAAVEFKTRQVVLG